MLTSILWLHCHNLNLTYSRLLWRYVIKTTDSTVRSSEIDLRPRNMLLIKNPQFSPNFYDTLSKYPTHELVILAKCHKNWVKIVDFLLIAYFWACGQFRWTILYVYNCRYLHVKTILCNNVWSSQICFNYIYLIAIL